MPLVSFYTPWKHQETKGFLIFSGCIERDEWHDMGLNMASMTFLHKPLIFREQNIHQYIDQSDFVNDHFYEKKF